MKSATACSLRCPDCGRSYLCDPAGDCWCKSTTTRLPVPETPDATCVCPCQLQALAKARTSP